MVGKSIEAKIKLIVGIIGVIIVFSVLLLYLPSLNFLTPKSASYVKDVDVMTINKYFGGNWVENLSASGSAKIGKNNVTVIFANGTTKELSLADFNLINSNISSFLGIVKSNLNEIHFTTFTRFNETLVIIFFNYTSTYEPHQIFDEAYNFFSSIGITNVTSNAFEFGYDKFQVGIGYQNYRLFVIIYQGDQNEFSAIADLLKYLLS